jgi:glycosyltransferase involved in cell wall biosynthesis
LTPTISIIIPSYNKENYITESIQSVLHQTYTDWELIIVDDQSSDKTVNIIKEFQKTDSRIKLFVNEKNLGANYSRNFGISKSQSELIIFLDADDILLPHCLKKRIQEITNSNYDFCVFTMGTFYSQIGDSLSLWKPKSTRPLIDFLQHKLPWQTMQPIWKRQFLVRLGGFDEQFKRLQDVEMHTRVLFNKEVNFKQIISAPDCYYRINEERKNFNTFQILERWVESSLLYYNKFYQKAKDEKLNRYLVGTIYKAYLQILYHFKMKQLSLVEFNILENKLLNKSVYLSKPNRYIFSISKKINLLKIRIPGVNFIISEFLIIK